MLTLKTCGFTINFNYPGNHFLQMIDVFSALYDCDSFSKLQNAIFHLSFCSWLNFPPKKLLWTTNGNTIIPFIHLSIHTYIHTHNGSLGSYKHTFKLNKIRLCKYIHTYVHTFNSCHRFSIGLASGDSGGIFHQFIPHSAKNAAARRDVCFGSLSCISLWLCGYTLCIDDTKCSSRI